MKDAPLAGLVVVDFTRVLAGPLCTMVLSDLGADVIKVERPELGDDTRAWGPPSVGDDATYFLAVNRDKRSVILDLTNPADQARARELIATADVVIENFRSGVMTRFGLDYEQLRRENPGLVYCSIPAFAFSDSPKPGYDLLMQALCGLMSLTGSDNQPTKTGVALLDVITGLYATTGITAAIASRNETGRGQHVTVGLFEASLSALVNQSAAYLMAGSVPEPAGNSHPSIVPYQPFDASDRAFVLAVGNDKLFVDAMRAMGHPEWATDARFATNSDRVHHRNELVGMLQAEFLTKPAADWVRVFDECGVPASTVRNLAEVFTSAEAQPSIATVDDGRRGPLRYIRTPILMSSTPLRDPSTPPPRLGQHTDDVFDREAARARAWPIAEGEAL